MKHLSTHCQRWMIRVGLSAIAVAVAVPATAQNYRQSRQDQQRQDQQRNWDQRQSQQRDWDQRQSQQQDWQQQQQRNQQRQSAQNSQLMRISPEAWIRVGYDFDRDGRVDAVEDVFAFELQQAKARSDERRTQMQRDRARQGQQRADRRDPRQSQRSDISQAVWDRQRQERMRQQRDQNQSRSALQNVQGTVSSTHTQKISGHDHEHLLAKIDTPRGTARVDLGPKQNLNQISIKQGDQIRVSGIRGTINGRQMLMAKRIEKRGGESVSVDREQPIDARRFKGTIQDTRDVAFRESDKEFVVAEVKLQNGRTTSVNLGPKNGLKNISLEEGDEIRLLARPGQIDGEMALIADEVWAKNKNISIDQPQDRQEFQMTARSQQQQNQQRQSAQEQQRSQQSSQNQQQQSQQQDQQQQSQQRSQQQNTGRSQSGQSE